MKELIRVRVKYASRQQCCKTHKRPLHLSFIPKMVFNVRNFIKLGVLFYSFSLLGTFPKLQKVTISFVMSVCLSVRMEQLGSHWTKIMKYDI